jgi:hypothetical protein
MKEENDQLDEMLRNLMQESGLEQAPSGFTQSVMGQISAEVAVAKRKWKPIISPLGWIGAAASLVAGLIVALMYAQPRTKALPGQPQTEAVVNNVAGFFEGLQFPMVLVLSLVAVAVLFGLDLMMGRRNRQAM